MGACDSAFDCGGALWAFLGSKMRDTIFLPLTRRLLPFCRRRQYRQWTQLAKLLQIICRLQKPLLFVPQLRSAAPAAGNCTTASERRKLAQSKRKTAHKKTAAHLCNEVCHEVRECLVVHAIYLLLQLAYMAQDVLQNALCRPFVPEVRSALCKAGRAVHIQVQSANFLQPRESRR